MEDVGQVEESETGKTDIIRLKLFSLSLTDAHGDPKVGSEHNLTNNTNLYSDFTLVSQIVILLLSDDSTVSWHLGHLPIQVQIGPRSQ